MISWAAARADGARAASHRFMAGPKENVCAVYGSVEVVLLCTNKSMILVMVCSRFFGGMYSSSRQRREKNATAAFCGRS